MKPHGLLSLVAVTTCLGYARTSPPPSPAELREYELLEANEHDASKLFQSGIIGAGVEVLVLWSY
jgi:hypothetical protein